MPLLDELSGLEFEAKMTTVFDEYGYDNVRQTPKTGDKGRDILMRETVNGQERAVVVECKHKEQVSRGEIQKLHSAVIDHDYPGPTRGMVVTSGGFSEEAKEHVEHLRRNVDGTVIELVDGTQVREIGTAIGMNLRNGHIELACNHILPPVESGENLATPIRDQVNAIDNIDAHDLPESDATIQFQPVVSIHAETDTRCENPSGTQVLRRGSERDEFVLDGMTTPPASVDDSLREILTTEPPQTVPLSDWQETGRVTDTTVERFAQDKTEYTEWTVDQLQSKYAETIPYTGNNNADYEEDCVPDSSDISVTAVSPMYVPRVRSQISLKEYDYTLEYNAAGAERHTIENELNQCVHCGWSWLRLTYCEHCGAIACWRHTKTERLDGEPICTGCAVTARFGLRKRYFSTEANSVEFREEYNGMALSRKMLENWPWIATAVLVIVGLLVVLLI